MMTHTLVRRFRRWRVLVTAAGAMALAASASSLPAASASAGAAAQAAAATLSTPWPTSPDWQSYVEAPSGSTVCPVAIESTSGTVTGAQNLVCGGSGSATLTMASGGATPRSCSTTARMSAASRTSRRGRVGSPRYCGPGTARGSSTCQRQRGRLRRRGPRATLAGRRYTVTGPGTITDPHVQGGERYEEITLTSPGTVTLSAAGIRLTRRPQGPIRDISCPARTS